MEKKIMPLIIFLFLLSCREQSEFQKNLSDIKTQISILEKENSKLEQEYSNAGKARQVAIDRQIVSNSKKIDKLTSELTRQTKDTQKRILKSISSEAKKRSGGDN